MRIVRAELQGFRNLAPCRIEFSPRVNLLLGRNGMGKTNLLEALAFFALGRSHRGARLEDIVAFDAEALHVRIELEETEGALVSCELGLDREGGKRLRLDGDLVKRRADLVGRLITVFFNPDSIRLVRGGPSRRRQFVDQGQAELDPLYLDHLLALQRVIRQKTALLRDLRRGVADPAAGRAELRAWNKELAGHAAAVCIGRAHYASQLTDPAGEFYNKLTDNDLEFTCRYRPKLACLRDLDPENTEQTVSIDTLAEDIRREIDYIMGTEINSGRPLTGPQMDDFEIRADDLDLRVFGSQGETRSAAISLIMARSEVLYRKRRIRPVLFFDDIFSELDRERTRRLQDMATRSHQVFVATARDDDVDGWRPAGRRIWRVTEGRLSEETAETS